MSSGLDTAHRAPLRLWPLGLFLLVFLIGTSLPGTARPQDGPGPSPAKAPDPKAGADGRDPDKTPGPEAPPGGENAGETPDKAPDKAPDGTPAGDRDAAAAGLKTGRLEIESSIGERLRSVIGLLAILGICFALSNNRSRISWRLVAIGIGLQVLFGVIVLKTPPGERLFRFVNDLVMTLLGYSNRGAEFLFGRLLDPGFAGAHIAFSVLPTIIFFSCLMAVLYHVGVMQAVVRGLAVVMQKTMGTTGAETLSAAGNIFVGQTEAPLLIRPFVSGMSESELMAVMTGGFATIAGGVLAAYVNFLQARFPDIAGHLMTASIMSAPAALVCAKIMVPEPHPENTATWGTIPEGLDSPDENLVDAAARGASEGLTLALNVGAMLLAFLALVYLANDFVGYGFEATGLASAMGFEGTERVTLEWLLGQALRPLTWLMGVEWQDTGKVGGLFGTKTILNEFVAYSQLGTKLAEDPNWIAPRSLVIVSYSLCGFANFGSIGIQIGGISGIAPERRGDLARLAMRAMIGGTLAAFMTGTVAGILV